MLTCTERIAAVSQGSNMPRVVPLPGQQPNSTFRSTTLSSVDLIRSSRLSGSGGGVEDIGRGRWWVIEDMVKERSGG